MPIYLACGPEESVTSLPMTCRPARLGFHLAADYPSLLGPEVSAGENGTFLVLHDDVLPPYAPSAQLASMIVTLCAELGGGLICRFERTPNSFWQQLSQLLDEQAAQWNVPLMVPEQYAANVQVAHVIVEPTLGAMPFRHQAEAAASKYPARAILQLLPTRLDVTLPGSGTSLSFDALQNLMQTQSPAIFRDDALICDYFGYLENQQLHLVLFDTSETLAEKQKQAEAAGCAGTVGLYGQWAQYFESRYRQTIK